MRFTRLLLIAIVLFFASDVVAQCSQCSLLAEASGDGELGAGNNINTGILYIMAIVYIILMTAFIVIFRDQIKAFFKKKFKKEESVK